MEGGDTTNLLREDEYVDDPKEALTGGENLVGHEINLVFPLLGESFRCLVSKIPNSIKMNFSGSCNVCNIISKK